MNENYGTIESLKVTVLLEEQAGYDSGLLAQHGVSFLLEAGYGKNSSEGRTILFDTGQFAKPVLYNMEVLQVSPQEIDYIILSHCHYDHTGGLVGILNTINRCRVPIVAHPELHRPHYTAKPDLKPVGMEPQSTPEAIKEAGGEMILTDEPLPLMPGVITTGEIKERVDFEKSPTLALKTLQEGKLVSDQMKDDISLILIMPEGLVIVTGCAHAGIVSIVDKAIRLTGVEQVAAVIGGFHLIDGKDERIDKTLDALKAKNIGKIYAGHCTGFKAEAKMLMEFGNRFSKLHTGMKITFPGQTNY
ncbi:MAG: MBL fold metallo-hydrolase [Bacillota bacterium]